MTNFSFENIAKLTPQDIAEGRAQAQREYEAKLAFFGALEAYQKTAAGELPSALSPANTALTGKAPEKSRFFALEALSGVSAQEAEKIARTDKAFDVVGTLKDKILLIVFQSNGIMPTNINSRLKEVGAVDDDYPLSNVSPKISAYRDQGLLESRSTGWHVTASGVDRIITAIMQKGSDHAA
jgi:hypothetical protein